MCEAVLFDMDGVIVDTEQSVTAFWQRIADLHGVTLTTEDLQRHVYGRPADRTLDALFPDLAAAERQTVHATMHEHETRDTYHALPGVVNFLDALQREAIPTALVTSGEPWKVEAVMSQLGVAGLFAVQVTASDIREGKPHPGCYLLAANKLGTAPELCLVFEDAVSGVEAAVAAGTMCIGIASAECQRALLEVGARYTIPDFSRVVCGDGALDLGNGTILPLGPGRPG